MYLVFVDPFDKMELADAKGLGIVTMQNFHSVLHCMLHALPLWQKLVSVVPCEVYLFHIAKTKRPNITTFYAVDRMYREERITVHNE